MGWDGRKEGRRGNWLLVGYNTGGVYVKPPTCEYKFPPFRFQDMSIPPPPLPRPNSVESSKKPSCQAKGEKIHRRPKGDLKGAQPEGGILQWTGLGPKRGYLEKNLRKAKPVWRYIQRELSPRAQQQKKAREKEWGWKRTMWEADLSTTSSPQTKKRHRAPHNARN